MVAALRIKTSTFFCFFTTMIVVGVIFFFVQTISQKTRNAYAVWWVGDMVVEHMESNQGKWPTNWEELRDDYQTCAKRSGQPWRFDDLKRRVTIDWEVDPQILISHQDSGQPEFRVIYLTDGSDTHWQNKEPNQMVLDYLIARTKETKSNPTATKQ